MNSKTLWVVPALLACLLLSMTSQNTRSFIRARCEVTGRDFYTYLRELGISEREVYDAHGQLWLSVGEGTSNFTAEIADRGIESMAVDALVRNPFAPERSVIGLVQDLPFKDSRFDRIVAMYLMDYFYDKDSFNDKDGGQTALQEMIRVVKVGGDIRIGPIKNSEMIAAVESLKKLGTIDYELLPFYTGRFVSEKQMRVLEINPVENATPRSIRIVRLK